MPPPTRAQHLRTAAAATLVAIIHRARFRCAPLERRRDGGGSLHDRNNRRSPAGTPGDRNSSQLIPAWILQNESCPKKDGVIRLDTNKF
ncbi:hypothetical protein MTO96_048344 [Rhipicephalus appendiculatus]